MTTRRRLRRELERVRHRLARLAGAERNRDEVTAKRKAHYLELRLELGDEAPATRKALRSYRASRDLSHKIDMTQAVLRRRAHNKLEDLRRFNESHPFDSDRDGLIKVDGIPVARGVAKEVLRIRRAGRWKGQAVSGFRTPEHSEDLCFDMCGAPKCPGRCAGRDTRHAQKPPEQDERAGAIDLTDFVTFARECDRLDSWLENHLPADLVHFSDVGN